MEKPVTLPHFDTLPSPQEIVQITHWLQQAGLHELELKNSQGLHLRLVAGGGSQPASPPPNVQTTEAAEPATTPVTTPYFGHLLLQDPATQKAFAPVGHTVREGESVAILDLGSITVAVHAPCAGVVSNITAQEGELVGYGRTIMSIKPA